MNFSYKLRRGSCDHCGWRFNKKRNLVDHNEIVHGILPDVVRKTQRKMLNKRNYQEVMPCAYICGYSSENLNSLLCHERKVHCQTTPIKNNKKLRLKKNRLLQNNDYNNNGGKKPIKLNCYDDNCHFQSFSGKALGQHLACHKPRKTPEY